MKPSSWDRERGKLDSFMLASLAPPTTDGKTNQSFQITICARLDGPSCRLWQGAVVGETAMGETFNAQVHGSVEKVYSSGIAASISQSG